MARNLFHVELRPTLSIPPVYHGPMTFDLRLSTMGDAMPILPSATAQLSISARLVQGITVTWLTITNMQKVDH